MPCLWHNSRSFKQFTAPSFTRPENFLLRSVHVGANLTQGPHLVRKNCTNIVSFDLISGLTSGGESRAKSADRSVTTARESSADVGVVVVDDDAGDVVIDAGDVVVDASDVVITAADVGDIVVGVVDIVVVADDDIVDADADDDIADADVDVVLAAHVAAEDVVAVAAGIAADTADSSVAAAVAAIAAVIGVVAVEAAAKSAVFSVNRERKSS